MRADFYVGRGKTAEWLGSIAWDGYPDGIEKQIFTAADEALFRLNVKAFLESRDDGTFPADGWPWPWDDSNTTDYAYAFDDGKVWASGFGSPWFDPLQPEPEETDDTPFDEREKREFPNMKDKQNVTFGRRSGVIVVGFPKET